MKLGLLRCVAGTILFFFIFSAFFIVGSLNLGEECDFCLNGETFTKKDLFNKDTKTTASIFALIGTIFIVGAGFILEKSEENARKKEELKEVIK